MEVAADHLIVMNRCNPLQNSGIIIISLLRYDRYKNENTGHNTTEQIKTKFPKN